MRIAILILLTLSFAPFFALAESATGTVGATIVSPISISTSAISFGSITAPDTGGAVLINSNGGIYKDATISSSITPTISPIVIAGTSSGVTYSISIRGSNAGAQDVSNAAVVTLNGLSGSSMRCLMVLSNSVTSTLLPGDAPKSLNIQASSNSISIPISAKLEIGPRQLAGSYSGQYEIFVTY